MNRLPETVTTKFTELFAALHYAADDLKMAGAEANLMGDFSQVVAINDKCRNLMSLEAELKASLNHFQAKDKARTAEKTGFHKKDRYRTRKPSGRLRITVDDKVIEESTIAETFVKTLRALGLERVARLNKVICSIPLIDKKPANGYQTQRRCEGWLSPPMMSTPRNRQSTIRLLPLVKDAGKTDNYLISF